MIYILPYKAGSNSVKILSESLRARIIKLENSKFKPSLKKAIINWGNNNIPEEYKIGSHSILNVDVAEATNKLSFFNKVAGKQWCIPFTSDKDVAQQWIDEGKEVVCRTLLNAHSGRGIVISNKENPLVDAPLYTQYVKKKDEYRVHIFKHTGAFLIQKKVRNKDVPDENVNWKVRNHDNGFVFAVGQEYVEDTPAEVKQAAREVINLINLDFGAVDIIWNDKFQQAYVLEVNTAPGLEEGGKTHEFYTNCFDYYRQEKGL